jgi:hypothetical protein
VSLQLHVQPLPLLALVFETISQDTLSEALLFSVLL